MKRWIQTRRDDMNWLKSIGIVLLFITFVGVVSEIGKWYQSHCPKNVQITLGLVVMIGFIIFVHNVWLKK